jgi:hypothetical protein
MQKRNRKIYAPLMLMVIGLGLASRKYGAYLPSWLADYAGDTLWALLVFLMMGFLLPRHSTRTVAIFALVFAFFIELTQLYHAPWLDSIRQYRLAALILGYDFLWTDLLCYSVGIAIGVFAEVKVKSVVYR